MRSELTGRAWSVVEPMHASKPRLSPLAERLDMTRKVDGAPWVFDPAAIKLKP